MDQKDRMHIEFVYNSKLSKNGFTSYTKIQL